MANGLIVAVWIVGLVLVAGLAFKLGRRSQRERQDGRDVASRQQRELLALAHQLAEGELQSAQQFLVELVADPDTPLELHLTLAVLFRRSGQLEQGLELIHDILAHEDLPEQLAVRSRAEQSRLEVEVAGQREGTPSVDSQVSSVQDQRPQNSEPAEVGGTGAPASPVPDTLESERKESLEEWLDPESVARMSEEMATQGNTEAAVKGFRRVLRMEPGNLRAHIGLSNLYLEQGKKGKAKQHLVSALETRPSMAPALLPRLRTVISQQSHGEVEEYDRLLEGLAAFPEAELWVRLEQVDRLYQKDQLTACRALLEPLIEAHPRSLEVHEAYLNLLIELDDERAIQQAIERFLDLAAEEIARYHCQVCRFSSPNPFWECPNCRNVGTLEYRR
ncbi:MAG: tetratricopeptide repeat protein [Bradymonadales bacterium]|nr:tetratricopeptide repeat protein [Bradymonadales bacterium]